MYKELSKPDTYAFKSIDGKQSERLTGNRCRNAERQRIYGIYLH
jgi:hypothetical protein